MKNKMRSFDQMIKRLLGRYIYALQDPRDNKIFYVGQGRDNRIFQHLEDAKNNLNTEVKPTKKIEQIQEIWDADYDVECHIIAHSLPDNDKFVNFLESSTLDALAISPNGRPLNEIDTPNSTYLSMPAILRLSAKNISPEIGFKQVFIFPIQNALGEGKNEYEACRGDWRINAAHLKNNNSYAVGIDENISAGAFKITSWNKLENGKYAFEGKPIKELLGFNWQNIIRQGKRYWRYGNYLIIEFNGNAFFRFIHGNSDKTTWYSCEP